MQAELKALLERHLERTASPRARGILDDWENQLPIFWRVAPVEQVAALEAANEGVTEKKMAKPNSVRTRIWNGLHGLMWEVKKKISCSSSFSVSPCSYRRR